MVCPGCDTDWPADRFNGKDAECFRCRAGSMRFSFGPGGKDFFHNMTNKEWADDNITKARANGLDPVPVGKGTYAGPLKMPAVVPPVASSDGV